jgi:release factor glutamine methyltransferase
MNISELINIGSNILKKNKITSHLIDSELLLSKTLQKPREEILINFDQNINDRNITEFKKFISRRSKNEPIAYILGEKEFWSKKFTVNRNTLIPRPETELLVEILFKKFKDKKISILDIGTGSGCIIISLLSSLKHSHGVGIDISKEAIEAAKTNALRHKLQNRLRFIHKPFQSIYNKKFDLIVSNPPYIMSKDLKNLSEDIKKYEPRIALDGGNDGLDLIRKVIYKSKNILKLKGTLALEIGNEQIKKVSKILFDNNYRVKNVIKDYKNNVRCVIADLTNK